MKRLCVRGERMHGGGANACTNALLLSPPTPIPTWPKSVLAHHSVLPSTITGADARWRVARTPHVQTHALHLILPPFPARASQHATELKNACAGRLRVKAIAGTVGSISIGESERKGVAVSGRAVVSSWLTRVMVRVVSS